MRVLVTGARTYYSLAAIRSLGRAGHHVTAADWHPHSLGFYSRFARARWVCPSLQSGSEAFVAALAAWLRRHPHDAVLPLYEEALALSKHAHLLDGLARLPLHDYGAMLRFHDKRTAYEFAAAHGVPVPPWRLVYGGDTVDLPFPIVLKVPQSSSAVGVQKVSSRDGVTAARRRLLADHDLPADAPLIAQQFVAARQLCTLSFAFHGRPKGTLVYRNLCEFPDRGGAGIARENLRHAAIERHVDTLLRGSGWHGIIGFDFLEDAATGAVLLIDANPRPTPGLFLAQRCGLDLVAMALSAGEPAAASGLRTGLRTRIDPLVACWCLSRLLPRRRWWRDLGRALSFLPPKRASRSDVFDAGDLGSLWGLLVATADGLWSGIRGGGFRSVIRPSQYQDYELPAGR